MKVIDLNVTAGRIAVILSASFFVSVPVSCLSIKRKIKDGCFCRFLQKQPPPIVLLFRFPSLVLFVCHLDLHLFCFFRDFLLNQWFGVVRISQMLFHKVN